jgi:hypothetical protein
MRLREALMHARGGKTVFCGSREIRFLTFAEAEPILLREKPELDSDGNEFANPHFPLAQLGLYDVSGDEPVSFAPTDDDIYLPVELDAEGKEKPRALRADWEIVSAEVPAVVDPESVDEVLSETAPETLGSLDTEPPQ